MQPLRNAAVVRTAAFLPALYTLLYLMLGKFLRAAAAESPGGFC